jgi:hypothetical protein
MSDLPKPAFSTDEEVVKGGQAIVQAGDTTTDNVEKAVPLGELILDSSHAYVRYHMKDGNLLYHVFRGELVPEKFWGSGEYGLVVLAMAEAYWPMDKPKVEFHVDTCRPEVHHDDPKQVSKYPAHFYGAYLIVVPGVDRKLMLTEERIEGMVDGLDDELKRSIIAWSSES